MQKGKFSLHRKVRLSRGLTLVEVAMVATICMVPVTAVGVLLIRGQRDWHKVYESANMKIEIEGQVASAIFERVGRKSDRDNCEIYSVAEAISPAKSVGYLVCGPAVEFRYWGDKRITKNISRIPPTEYARFYLDEDENKLKIDYGPYPYKTRRKIIRTVVIANNVTDVQFSRTSFNNIGQGSVRMKMTLTNPENGRTITILAATLMRN
jgi:hypothetical protein